MIETAAIFSALDATWPAARSFALAPWLIREGRGGGKRVSAAEARGVVGPDDIARAEEAMRGLGQTPLFVLRDEPGPLDARLAEAGYRTVDPTLLRACALDKLTKHHPPRVSAFTLWEPLQIMRDIWAAGGIGADRLAVMERAEGPKTGLMGRSQDKPTGAGFVAVSGDVAMVHALEVRSEARRQGTARHMMLVAAHWAAEHGARTMAVAVTEANAGANAFYAAMGLDLCGRYHYRIEG